MESSAVAVVSTDPSAWGDAATPAAIAAAITSLRAWASEDHVELVVDGHPWQQTPAGEERINNRWLDACAVAAGEKRQPHTRPLPDPSTPPRPAQQRPERTRRAPAGAHPSMPAPADRSGTRRVDAASDNRPSSQRPRRRP